jgi:hypothetical protein
LGLKRPKRKYVSCKHRHLPLRVMPNSKKGKFRGDERCLFVQTVGKGEDRKGDTRTLEFLKGKSSEMVDLIVYKSEK